MTLPALSNWDDTRTGLHQSLTPLLLAHLASVDPLPNALRYGMTPTSIGAMTFPLKIGGTLIADFTRLEIRYEDNGKSGFTVAFGGHSQRSLVQAVFAELAEAGHRLEPDMTKAEDTTTLKIDPALAHDYAGVQWRMALALARLKAHFTGFQTPVLVWGHGFDLSTLWFASGSDDHKDPHINFGFSPGTPDVGQPYVYFYAYPAIGGLQNRIPAVLSWHTTWSTPGGVLKYDTLRNASDPDGLIVESLLDVYRVAERMLRTG